MGRHGLHSVHHRAWEKHHDFPIRGVRSQKRMTALFTALNKDPDPMRRLQHVVYELKKSPQAFSGEQILQLLPFFQQQYFVMCLHLLDHHILGISCQQAGTVLNSLELPAHKLDALKVLSHQILDPVNRNSLLAYFSPLMQSSAAPIVDTIKGRSHAYGSITAQRVVFLIDTSGSMGTVFRTDCGETFNRLEYVVHDLHKILHHRVSPQFHFNIIRFAHIAHKWKHGLVHASSHNLKEAEHYLDELESHGGTNTHDALKMAIHEHDADAIYVLSDGEPTEGITDTRDIIYDVQNWLKQKKKPIQINTIAFLMGEDYNDPRPRQLMAQLASVGNGVYRCLDPHAPDHEEHLREGVDDTLTFDQDDSFITFFEQKMNELPAELRAVAKTSVVPSIQPSTIPYMPTPNYLPPQQTSVIPNYDITNANNNTINNTPFIDYQAAAKKRVRNPNDISILTTSQSAHGHHTVYNVTMNIRGIVPYKDITWSVSHTFSDFEHFHKHMKHYYGTKGLANVIHLPASTLLHHTDAQHVDQRRKDLENYLRTVYTHFSPYDVPEFDNFLLYEVNVNQVIAEAEVADTERKFQLMQMSQSMPPPPYNAIPSPQVPYYDMPPQQVYSPPIPNQNPNQNQNQGYGVPPYNPQYFG